MSDLLFADDLLAVHEHQLLLRLPADTKLMQYANVEYSINEPVVKGFSTIRDCYGFLFARGSCAHNSTISFDTAELDGR